MKKGKEELMELHLVKNPDIVATVASQPDNRSVSALPQKPGCCQLCTG